MNYETLRRTAARAAACLLFTTASALSAAAQTLTLSSSATVVRGGTYANTNLASAPILATRASDDPEYVRRILLKFDTQTTIPPNTPIASAVLTVTVAGGNDASRSIGAYRVASSFEATQTTWNARNSGAEWSAAGGDLAERYATATVTRAIGSRERFDVTSLVQGAVSGRFGSSRFTRIALVDAGPSSRASYKEYFSDEAADASVRPVLVVTLGSVPTPPAPTPVPPPPPPVRTSTELRVLQWNLHHGVGDDGKYDIDRIARWIVKMDPDVVMLNEVEKNTGWGNEDQPARYEALLEAKTGKAWYAVFAQEFGNWSARGKGHLILSKYKLESTDMTAINYDRVIAHARITVNGRTISLVLTHLDPESTSRRLTQAQEVMRWASAVPENRILTGDMNAWPDQSSIAEYYKAYSDTWTIAEGKGRAIGFSGLQPAGATKKGRIDYIMLSKNAPNLVVVESRVYDTREGGRAMASDHRPVMTTFEVR